MSESRTKKSLRNTGYSVIFKMSDVILSFVLRTVFIYTLGVSCLGLSGLFANILTVLSLMELGVGSAIVFSLYKPLSQGNHGKVLALMQLYKKTYNIIGVLVCVIGFSLTPFLEHIINLPENVEHLYLIYWASIANTAVSYFLAYRRSLLIADQRSDINTKNQIVFRVIRFFALSVALIITHNYIVYLVVDVINTFLSNLQINYTIKKKYKYIEEAIPEKLSKEEKNDILKYMSSGILFKIGQTVVNSTDNILISAFVGTILVGFYSNYSLVTSNIQILITLLFSGITASIGNYAVEKNREDAEKLYRKVFFVNYAIVYFFTVCIFALISPFVELWIGSDYILPDSVVVIITINFYLSSMQMGTESFLGAVGEMFFHNRYRSLIECIVNLAVSLGLVRYTSLGLCGVFLGTTVCFLCGRVWMDAHTLYKYWFRLSFKNYMKKYIVCALLTILAVIIGVTIRNIVFRLLGITIISWILSGICITVLSLIVFVGTFRKSNEFAYFMNQMQIIKNKLMEK